jgi:hypothetical protein
MIMYDPFDGLAAAPGTRRLPSRWAEFPSRATRPIWSRLSYRSHPIYIPATITALSCPTSIKACRRLTLHSLVKPCGRCNFSLEESATFQAIVRRSEISCRSTIDGGYRCCLLAFDSFQHFHSLRPSALRRSFLFTAFRFLLARSYGPNVRSLWT